MSQTTAKLSKIGNKTNNKYNQREGIGGIGGVGRNNKILAINSIKSKNLCSKSDIL